MRSLCRFVLVLLSLSALGMSGAIAQDNSDLTNAPPSGASLNFQKADIHAVIQAVSKITGKNFIVDPGVQGNVTVVTPTPINKKAIYQTFLSILQVLGYAAVPAGSAVKIVPESKAKQQAAIPPRHTASNGSDFVTKIVPIEHVPATTLVSILKPLMSQQSQLAVYPKDNTLIITDRERKVSRLQDIIARLDKADTTKLTIVRPRYADAADIVSALTKINTAAGVQGGSPGGLPIAADPRTNSIIIGGDQAQKRRLETLIRRLDTKQRTQANRKVIYLQNADAKTVAPMLKSFFVNGNQAQANADASKAGISILPDSAIDALIVSAPPPTMRAIQDIVKQIDIRRAQVLVEAVIAEVSSDKSRQLGIDLAALGNHIAFASLLDPDVLGALSGTSTPNADTLSVAQQGGSLAGSGNDALVGLVRALASDQDTNILSAPTLVTLDNVEAQISVGKGVPFLTGRFSTAVSSGGGDDGVNPFQTIERKDVGLKLTITPHITQGNTVRLDISQEKSSIDTTSNRAVDIVTNKRTLRDTVNVEDGKILVLGGLIDRQVTEKETRVPILGDLPILGYLFRSKSATAQKRNLMIFIRPIIIRDPKTASRYTREKYNVIRDSENTGKPDHVFLMPHELQPRIDRQAHPALKKQLADSSIPPQRRAASRAQPLRVHTKVQAPLSIRAQFSSTLLGERQLMLKTLGGCIDMGIEFNYEHNALGGLSAPGTIDSRCAQP